MIAHRVVVAERLDSLAPDDPSAMGSRRDLNRINGLMGNARCLGNALGSRRLTSVLEIGAGDGRFMVKLARRIRSKSPGGRLTLLDRQALVIPQCADALRSMGWRCEAASADAFDFLASPECGRYDAIVANLFLHHFEDDRLSRLLRLASDKTDLFVACEPERSGLGLSGTRLLGLIGCNGVTRHDARVSVLAGFRGREISSLWPDGSGWLLEERSVPPFSHSFRAERAS